MKKYTSFLCSTAILAASLLSVSVAHATSDTSTPATTVGQIENTATTNAPVMTVKPSDAGRFSVLIENIPQNVVEVLVPIWSDENGQDDIKWYSAKKDMSGKFFVDVDFSNHKNIAGLYHIHLYTRTDGGSLNGQVPMSHTFKQAEVMTPITSHYQTKLSVDKPGYLHVSISNIPSEVTEIRVPTWTDLAGQDDIIWYSAARQTNGIFSLDIPLKNHNFETGKYHLHIYSKTRTSQLQGKSGTSIQIAANQLPNIEKPDITVLNINQQKGTYSIKIREKEFSKRIKKVEIATWSEANQSNIKWRTPTNVNGEYTANIDYAEHSYKTGTYKNHVYITYQDNSRVGYIANSVSITNPKPATIQNYTPNKYPVGQCTWGAKQLAPWVGNYWGNAKQWLASARNAGFKTGTAPRVGAIAVWTGGAYGHVAVVTEVSSTTRIRVRESNYNYNQNINDYRGWFNPVADGVTGYIYP